MNEYGIRQALSSINRPINILGLYNVGHINIIAETTYNGFILHSKDLYSKTHHSVNDFYYRLRSFGIRKPTSFTLGIGFWMLYLVTDMNRTSEVDPIL